ncbi:nuclear transport factor 2 family protein [Rhodococcus opacus]|uniref:nuclear transport factor 2 family protein n=1 Tax=Rhodococcus opacus TaxID=37919 RepID=UPI00146F4DE9|nr:nuclear transport factor 2 family protein [Rhodococcus opacus]MDV7088938.1 nuclear transport factor 2 family protein [Rhodococcus opacus]WKN60227.1 nuclear transport factor 2 family protein [Rhodococcus opacus]
MSTNESAECIRTTLAAIAKAADDGRTDDYVAIFAPDAIWDIPIGKHRGHREIRETLEAIAPRRPQRHVVVNSIIEVKGCDASADSDFIFLVYGDSGWNIAAVGRYHDQFENRDGKWLLCKRIVSGQTPPGYSPPSSLAGSDLRHLKTESHQLSE